MYETALTLSVATFLVAGFYFFRHPAFSIFHPLTIYMAFHGVVFVLRPVWAWYAEFRAIYGYFSFTPSLEDKLTALLAANLGFVVFFVASLAAGNVPMRFKQDRFAIAERDRLQRIFPRVLAVCLPIGGYSMLHFWGGIDDGSAYMGMTLDRATGTFISTSGNGYLLEAQIMLASIGALIAWVYRFRLFALAPLAAFIVLRAGTGGRGPFVAALAMAALLYFYEKRQRIPAGRLALTVAVALAGFTVIGADRGAGVREVLGADVKVVRGPGLQEKFLEGMDFGNLEFFEYLVYVVPQRSGTYDYFLDNLQIFTEPIPRALWKNKPIGPPIKTIDYMKYGRPFGITRSLPGEGWVAWGWPGVIIWCGLWGWLLGWLYRKYAEGPQNTLHTAAYMIFLPILIVAYRDGSLVTIFRQGIFFFAPIAVWYGFSRAAGIPTAQALRFAAYRNWRKQRAAASGNGSAVTGNDVKDLRPRHPAHLRPRRR
ncbi:MAG: O-antigen polysaccharide polymerase Wzy [Novosphingobium sp.]